MNSEHDAGLISLLKSELSRADVMVNSYISISKESGGEICISANKAGLLRISLLLSKLAFAEKPGNHIHIDSASEADVAEVGLIVCYKIAPWES